MKVLASSLPCSCLAVLLLHSLLLLVAAQEEPRLGPDGRPLLNKPRPEMCRDRKYHEKYGRHHYFLSWREPWNKFEDWDWFNARNFCRERCMDLVSFEDPEEYRHFAKMLHRGTNVTCRVVSQGLFDTEIVNNKHRIILLIV